jgi:hypothetical protein
VPIGCAVSSALSPAAEQLSQLSDTRLRLGLTARLLPERLQKFGRIHAYVFFRHSEDCRQDILGLPLKAFVPASTEVAARPFNETLSGDISVRLRMDELPGAGLDCETPFACVTETSDLNQRKQIALCGARGRSLGRVQQHKPGY